MGSYYLDTKTNLAEVAFVVRDQWQNHGIGTFLLKHLMRIARRNGIRGFTAEVLARTSRCRPSSTNRTARSAARSDRRGQLRDGFRVGRIVRATRAQPEAKSGCP